MFGSRKQNVYADKKINKMEKKYTTIELWEAMRLR